MVVEFRGGFGSFEGGQNYARAFGPEAFAHAVNDAEASMKGALGLDKARPSKFFESPITSTYSRRSTVISTSSSKGSPTRASSHWKILCWR